MVNWNETVNERSLSWLLETDAKNPAVCYLALRDIIGLPEDSPELIEAKATAFSNGTIADILEAQRLAGHWVKPGPGYNPKYTGTVWSFALLAQAGADNTEPRVRRAAEYIMEHTVAPVGWFSYNGTNSGFLHCHAGYMAESLLDTGFGDDPRVIAAIELHARHITGDGIAPMGSEADLRYYHYSSAPGFVCSANGHLPCAWGAVKAMRALASVPAHRRTPVMNFAIERGKELFYRTDLTECRFPARNNTKPSGNWFKFGFPNFYVGDLLEILEVLSRLGEGADPRLKKAWKLVLNKQDESGRWPMEYSYNGKMWTDIEVKGEPSKWVTLRVLRALKAAFPDQ